MADWRSMPVAHTAVQEVVKGAFQRTESSFRNTVVRGSRFEPEGEGSLLQSNCNAQLDDLIKLNRIIATAVSQSQNRESER